MRTISRRLRGAAAAALTLTSAIVLRGRAPVVDAAPEPVLAVHGCAAIVTGPICELGPDRAVRVFVASAAPAAFFADDRALAPTRIDDVAAGRRYTLRVPEGARVLRMRADDATSIARVTDARAPSADERRILDLVGRGARDEALRVAREAIGAADDDARPHVEALLGALEVSNGVFDDGVARYLDAIRDARARGRPSDAARAAFALTYWLDRRHRFVEARRALATAKELASDPEGLAKIDFYEARLAIDTGDLRSAIEHVHRVLDASDRLGLDALRSGAEQDRAVILERAGRIAEALAVVRDALRGETAPGCARAHTLATEGHLLATLRADASTGDAAATLDPVAPLREARAVYAASCPVPVHVANAWIETAWAELSRGRLDAARAARAEAERVLPQPGPDERLDLLHLDGRIALASGDVARAIDAFTRQERLAASLAEREAERAATEGRAEALMLSGRREEALATFARAASIADATSLTVPLGEGRERYLRARERSEARRIELLVDLGRPAEALRAVRDAEARLLASFDEARRWVSLSPDARARWEEALGAYWRARDALDAEAADDWKLSAETQVAVQRARGERASAARGALDAAIAAALGDAAIARARAAPRRGPGELVLAYFPIATGWLGLAEDARGAIARRLGPIDWGADRAALAGALLGPFDAAIADARRIVVVAHGAARGVDLHALPWRERPLVAHAPVVYSLGLADRAATDGDAPARRALVVADPTRNLPGAAEEASIVTRALTAAAWRVRALRGAEATAASVREALGGVDLFHFAGHGAFGGEDGWESKLPLASRGELTVADVLASPRVAPHVVLFGCGTARTTRDTPFAGLGLASAFLAAGARSVLATTRDVRDDLASAMAGSLYAALARGGAIDDAEALRAAQLDVRARDPAADWAAFAAFAP